jgi:hypothetical protein
MNSFARLDHPYSLLYCYQQLVISGPNNSDPKKQALVRLRIASVRRWFIEHGYDPTLIQAHANGGGPANQIDWEIVGGIGTRRRCEEWRAAARRK